MLSVALLILKYRLPNSIVEPRKKDALGTGVGGVSEEPDCFDVRAADREKQLLQQSTARWQTGIATQRMQQHHVLKEHGAP